jgi:uncharacterized membrane protein YuzA (DUF378 family)
MNPQPTPTPKPADNSATRMLFFLYLALLIIGGLNWGLYAINKDFDLVDMVGKAIQGVSYSLTARIVYAIVGICALLAALSAATSSSAIFASN